MIQYHAVFQTPWGTEFGADCEASSKEEAREWLRGMYPESRIVQLESPEDTRERQHAIYARVSAEYDDCGWEDYDE